MGVSFKFSPLFTVNGVEIPVVMENGESEVLTLNAKFKRATYTECADLKRRQDIEVIKDRLDSLSVVDNKTGAVEPLSAETTAELLEVASAPYALALAFFRASQGTPAKNS